jgi:hypothetical protein
MLLIKVQATYEKKFLLKYELLVVDDVLKKMVAKISLCQNDGAAEIVCSSHSEFAKIKGKQCK